VNKKTQSLEALHLLLVEDNSAQAQLVKDMIDECKDRQYSMTLVDTLKSAQQAMKKKTYQLILLDLNLPDSRGNETLKTLHAAFPDIPIIVLTGVDDIDGEYNALELGAQDYLVKGCFSDDDLMRAINHALHRHHNVLAVEEERNLLRNVINDIKKGDIEAVLNSKDASSVMHLLDGKQAEELLAKIKSQRKALKWMASRDTLTQLYNRGEFESRLSEMVSLAKRHHYSFAVFFIDIDKFKEINDTQGHAAGDELLKALADRWENSLRKGDILARLGGDEFGVLTPYLQSPESAGIVAEKLLQTLDQPFQLATGELILNVSIGIAIYPDTSETAEDLLIHADIAMYRAKQSKKNAYEYYTQDLQKTYQYRTKIKTALSQALKNDEFHLVYQPIIDLKTMGVAGMEVLIRWSNAEFANITPDQFIPMAEEEGLILSLDHWVIQHALKQYSVWKDQFDRSLIMNINLSAHHLATDDAVDRLCQVLKGCQLDLSCVSLELTETAIMSDPEVVALRLHKIKQLGVSFSIDDFGTGYSSLVHLKALPVSELKIDRSFVSDVLSDVQDEAIVKSMISLSDNLGLETVAEGIETKEQLAFLVKEGCKKGQGYYFSKPLAADKMTEYLETMKKL
jgi:diguanylate cyclase (GGDEF)-like protein